MAVFLLMQKASMAQRNCNLELNMLSPYYNSVIQRGAPVDVTVTVKNLGPDAVKTSDTINYFIAFDNNYVYVGNSILGLRSTGTALPVNGTPVTVSVFKGLQFNSLIDGYHDFCVVAILQNHSADSSQDTLPVNNTACKKVWLNKFLVGNNVSQPNAAVALYPNPASHNLHVTYALSEKETATLSLMSLTGQVLQQTQVEGSGWSGSHDLDVSSLESGVYMIQLKSGDAVYTAKFIRQ